MLQAVVHDLKNFLLFFAIVVM